MKTRILIFAVLITALPLSTLVAQCDTTRNGKYTDYCFTDELFPEVQMAYKLDEENQLLINGKKEKVIPAYSAEKYESTMAWMLALANDKKLKLSAKEMVFIMASEEDWSVAQRSIGFEFEESGLGIKVISLGDGEMPEKGKDIKVHYTGYLEDGTKFDSSVDRGQPFSFPLGKGRVIKGWDEGVAKLPIGTKAVLLIPSDLGYGSRGAGGVIPPNATLFFEIEVIGY